MGLITVLLCVINLICLPLTQGSPNLRNTGQEEAYPSDGPKVVLAHALLAPRQVLNGTLWGIGKVSATLSDPDFIERVEDILYLYERDLAWFPIGLYASGYRPVYGGGLYYKHEGINALFRGMMHDSNYWSLDFKTSYRGHWDKLDWKISFMGVLENHDDKKFYGIGSDPVNDSRNQFISLTEQDYGVLSQNRRKLQWSGSLLHPDENWQITYLGFVQRRSFKDEGSGENNLRDVFNLSRIPGFTTDAPVKHLYNELSFIWDTRQNKKIIGPGWRSEIYAGISNGLDHHESDLFRTGFDLTAFVPTIREDRILSPRVVFDMVEELDRTPIPFTEYPRQNTFRGISSREWIRNDAVSVVPSIEYQWPISHMFSGHLFFDFLAVGPSLGKIAWEDGLWATGVGLNLHCQEKELGKIEFAGGSEGLEMRITVGKPLRTNHRKDW
ncbi:MAG: hypothetical protein JW893_05825 [Candidatus Omnitrophica bacterium]|nr:hypothetical protein [Candidatus Omnitrophota bacterium]